jgi:hypothetical protein
MEYTISNGNTTAIAIIEPLTVVRPHTKTYFKNQYNEFDITGLKIFKTKLLACYIDSKPSYKVVGHNIDKLLRDIIPHL